MMGHVKHIRPSPVIGGKTGGRARNALNKLTSAIEQPQQIKNWTQLNRPIVNRRESSINPVIDSGSSRQTEIEQQREFNILLK